MTALSNLTVLRLSIKTKEKWISTHRALLLFALDSVERVGSGEYLQQLGTEFGMEDLG